MRHLDFNLLLQNPFEDKDLDVAAFLEFIREQMARWPAKEEDDGAL